MRVAFVAVLSCALVAAASSQGCGRELLSYNFDEHVGEYKNWTTSEMEAAFPKGEGRPDFRGEEQQPGLVYAEGIERASVGEQNLRLFMPETCTTGVLCICFTWELVGEEGKRGYIENNVFRHVALRQLHCPSTCYNYSITTILVTVRLPDEVDEATLSYRFKFSDGYDWTLGGKLPGLADEDMASGCTSDDVSGTGSFVSRTMWRAEGQLVTYMYITPIECECINGEDWPYTRSAQEDKWSTLFMYIKLNSPGVRNGLHKVWIQEDGVDSKPELVYSRNEVYYRSIAGHGIAKLKFDNFHGGSDERYMPNQDQFVYFDDIKVTEGLCVEAASEEELSVAAAPDGFGDIDTLGQQDFGNVDSERGRREVQVAGPGEDAFLSLADEPTVCSIANSTQGGTNRDAESDYTGTGLDPSPQSGATTSRTTATAAVVWVHAFALTSYLLF